MTEPVKTGPFSEDVAWEITAFEPSRMSWIEADSGLGRSQVSYMFEAVDEGIQLSAEVYMQLIGIYR